MNILITGGTGFIGLQLVDRFVKNGHKVKVLVRDKEKALRLLGNKCDVFIGDITDRNSLKGCCEGIDIVYQLVAKVGNELPSNEALEQFRKVNVEGLSNICQEAIEAKVKKFIFVSSIAAMGIVRNGIINENSPCEPYLPYQISKREGELLILKLVNNRNFPGIIVRPAKVYGKGEREYSYLSVAKLCKIGIFPKVGFGKNLVSHCYISDLIDGLEHCLYNGNIGSIYILASDKSIGLNESAKLIANLLGKNICFIPIPKFLMVFIANLIEKTCSLFGRKAPVTKRNVEAATTDRIYDLSTVKKELNFSPKVSMVDGITKVIAYYKEKGLL